VKGFTSAIVGPPRWCCKRAGMALSRPAQASSTRRVRSAVSVPGSRVRPTMVMLAATAFLALNGALAAIGLVSWRRTKSLRSGRRARSQRLPVHAPTSRLTALAGWAGIAAALWGGISLTDHAVLGLALLAGGGFIVLAGFWARVTAIEGSPAGLSIRYARRRAFTATWPECRALRPPSTPLGGWRIECVRSARTLMPSDLWRHEHVLDSIVRAAGLRFDGRAWVTGRSHHRPD